MAITMTKEPSALYPAYNDSYIQFESDLSSDLYAEITLYPALTFPNVFKIYPDSNGTYTFNLKEAVKVVLNEDGFEDAGFDLSVYSKSISGVYLNQQVDIEVFNASTSETTTKYYTFLKAVKQIAENIHSSLYQLLMYSPNGIDHVLTYFEGFPFHFDILRATSGADVTIKNLNTSIESDPFIPTATETFRINIDKSNGDNWTTDNILPLIEGESRLEIYEDAVFKSNLRIKKKKDCSGVYLKWFNRNGGFSHYLFEEYYLNQNKASEIGTILNKEFDNIDSATGLLKSIGKASSGNLAIKAKFDNEEHENMKDLLNSPFVQMYSSQEANVEGEFIDVSVEGVLSFANKRARNEMNIIVNVPEIINAIL